MARPIEFDRTKALDQAVEVFRCKGYSATSMEELLSAMSIKAGSLYNTFGDKHRLFIQALNRYEATTGKCLFEPLDDADVGLEGIRAVFRNLIESEMSDPHHRGCLMLNSMLELADYDPEVKALATQGRQNAEQLFLRALQNAQRRGEIAATRDTADLAMFLVGVVYGIRVTAKTVRSREVLARMVETALMAVE